MFHLWAGPGKHNPVENHTEMQESAAPKQADLRCPWLVLVEANSALTVLSSVLCPDGKTPEPAVMVTPVLVITQVRR